MSHSDIRKAVSVARHPRQLPPLVIFNFVPHVTRATKKNGKYALMASDRIDNEQSIQIPIWSYLGLGLFHQNICVGYSFMFSQWRIVYSFVSPTIVILQLGLFCGQNSNQNRFPIYRRIYVTRRSEEISARFP